MLYLLCVLWIVLVGYFVFKALRPGNKIEKFFDDMFQLDKDDDKN